MTTAAASGSAPLHEGDANVPHSRDGVAFWNVHAPPSQRTPVCPDWLVACDDADRAQLALHDDEYVPWSWADVRATIQSNRLGDFKRLPSELWRYRAYMEDEDEDEDETNAWRGVQDIKTTHGSVMKYMLAHRLHWTDVSPADSRPFANAADYKVLANDWPYGIDKRIRHLVVWVKFGLDEDAATGDLTRESRRQIEEWVRATFVRGDENGREHVAWFKNWAQLKSVHAIEHFHVMLFDPDPAFVKDVTGADLGMSERAG